MKRLLSLMIITALLLGLAACELKEPANAPEQAASDEPVIAPDETAEAEDGALVQVSSPAPEVEMPTPEDEAYWEAYEELFKIGENVRPFADGVTARKDGVNYIYSPLSTWLCYSFLSEGLTGETRDLLMDKLESVETLEPESRDLALALLTDHMNQEGGAINLKNYLFYLKGKEVQDSFLESAENYRAGIYRMDLERNVDVTDHINALIERETYGLIPEFYGEPIDPTLTSILMNILALNAEWTVPFDPADTKEEPFYLTDGTTVDVPMMQLEEVENQFLWGEDTTAQYLRLPYKTGESIVLILPHEGETPEAALAHWLTPETVKPYFETFKVNLKLPKVCVESTWPLKQALSDMGLGFLFEPLTPGMDGILVDSSFYVADSKQKAVIEIFEEGTKAAAVTDIQMEEAAMLPPTEAVTLVFDRPFAFVVYSGEGNIELFRGVVHDPTDQ